MSAIIIFGCSRRKSGLMGVMPALDLYQGGGVPRLKMLIEEFESLRKKAFILSAKYGLVHVDEVINSYDMVLDLRRARNLRDEVSQRFISETRGLDGPLTVFVLAEPIYFSVLEQALTSKTELNLVWEPDVRGGLENMIESITKYATT